MTRKHCRTTYKVVPVHGHFLSTPISYRNHPRTVTVAETVTVSVIVSVIVGVALFSMGTIVNAGVGTRSAEDD